MQDRAAECAAIGTLLRERAGSGQQCQKNDGRETATFAALKSRRHRDEVLIVGVVLWEQGNLTEISYLAAYRILTTLARLLNHEPSMISS